MMIDATDRGRIIAAVERYAAGFREDQHPRDKIGEFTAGGNSAESSGAAIAQIANPAVTLNMVRQHSNGWESELEDDERDAIENYTLNSDKLNSSLRRGTLAASRDREAVEYIDEALEKSSFPDAIPVYRGLTSDPEWDVGESVAEKGYTSASLNHSIADDFADGGAMLSFVIPKGVNAAYIARLSPSYSSEAEMLLPRGLKFRITGKDHNGDIPVYTAEIVMEEHEAYGKIVSAINREVYGRAAYSRITTGINRAFYSAAGFKESDHPRDEDSGQFVEGEHQVSHNISPKRIAPLHGVKDASKRDALAQHMQSHGWVGRPILAYDDGNGIHGLTGSHRLAAAKAAGLDEVPVYVVDMTDQMENGEDHWSVRLIESQRDDDRMDALLESGDESAIALMAAEISGGRGPKKELHSRFRAAFDRAIYKQVHAPAGGAVVAGKKFTGGEFIPGSVLAKASAQEKAKLNGGGAQPAKAANPKGPRTPPPQLKPRTKSEIAKSSAFRVDHEIQRYAEEGNEPKFAKAIGGKSLPDNEPVDIVIESGGKRVCGIELKTMVSNKANKLTMKRTAMEDKARWERKNKAPVHTVVYDDTAVFNANGPGQHDESKRRIFYRRGYGSMRVGGMFEVKGGHDELRKLLNTPNRQLPPQAKSTVKK